MKKTSPKSASLTIERRSAPRASRVIAIKHRLIKRSSKKIPGIWSLSSTRNMSVSGILFLSNEAYKVGDILEISVTMSGVIDIFTEFAEVVRVDEKSPKSFIVAVRFVTLKPRSRSAKTHL